MCLGTNSSSSRYSVWRFLQRVSCLGWFSVGAGQPLGGARRVGAACHAAGASACCAGASCRIVEVGVSSSCCPGTWAPPLRKIELELVPSHVEQSREPAIVEPGGVVGCSPVTLTTIPTRRQGGLRLSGDVGWWRSAMRRQCLALMLRVTAMSWPLRPATSSC